MRVIQIITLVVVLLAVVGGGWLILNNQKQQGILNNQIASLIQQNRQLAEKVNSLENSFNSQVAPQVNTNNNLENINQGSSGKYYNNTTFGFSFYYPTDWYFTEAANWFTTLWVIRLNPTGQAPLPDTDQPNLAQIEIYESLSKLDWEQKGYKTLVEFLSKDPQHKNYQPLVIGGKAGYTAEWFGFAGGHDYFVELKGGKILRLWTPLDNAAKVKPIIDSFSFGQ